MICADAEVRVHFQSVVRGDILFNTADTYKSGVGCATCVKVSGTMIHERDYAWIFKGENLSVVSKLVVKCLEFYNNILPA
jgi:hypothetical protein